MGDMGGVGGGITPRKKGDSETSPDSETRLRKPSFHKLGKPASETRGQIPKPRFGNPASETSFGNPASGNQLRKLGRRFRSLASETSFGN